MVPPISETPMKNEHQWSINDFRSCILHNRRALRQLYSIMVVLATFIPKNATNDIATAP